MSRFSYPYPFGARPAPGTSNGVTYLDEQPIYGDTAAPAPLPTMPPHAQLAAPQGTAPAAPAPYFALQNQRSDRQRAQTIRNNANTAAGNAATAAAAPLPGDQAGRNARAGFINRQQTRSTQLNEQIDGPPPPPLVMLPGKQAQQYKPANPKDRATAYREYTLGGMDPAEATKRVDTEFASATQQPPPLPGAPPAPAAPTTQPSAATPPPATPQPSHGKEGIQMSEQIAREMLRAMSLGNPSTFEQIKPEFVATVGKYGVDGNAMWDKWTQEGTLGKFDYPTGQSTTTPAQPQVIAAPDAQRNTGGIATLPGGQTVVTNPNGRQVGGAIAQGPPLPSTTTPVMGAQPGMTPAPMLPTGGTIPAATPSSNLVNAGTGPGGNAAPIPFPGSGYPPPTSAAMASAPTRPQQQQPVAPPPQPPQAQFASTTQQPRPAAPAQRPAPQPQQRAGGYPISQGTAPAQGGVAGTGPLGEVRYGNGTTEMSQQFAGNAPRVASADQYHALPAGSTYYDPAGNLRRKQ